MRDDTFVEPDLNKVVLNSLGDATELKLIELHRPASLN